MYSPCVSSGSFSLFVLFILNGFAGLIIWIYFGYNFPTIYELILISISGFIGAIAFLFVSYGDLQSLFDTTYKCLMVFSIFL